MKAPDLTSTVVAGVVGAVLFFVAAAVGYNIYAPSAATEGYLVGAGVDVTAVKQKILLTGFAFGAIVQVAVRLLGVS